MRKTKIIIYKLNKKVLLLLLVATNQINNNLFMSFTNKSKIY